ncbi:hypothetical protein D3C72_2449610 [compost metagenome]
MEGPRQGIDDIDGRRDGVGEQWAELGAVTAWPHHAIGVHDTIRPMHKAPVWRG